MSPRQPNRRSRFAIIAIVIAVVLGLAGGGAIWLLQQDHSKDSSAPYQPKAAEAPMFEQLRHATRTEAKQGTSAANGELARDWKHPTAKDKYDVYVATGDFRTAYTDHRMVIMVRPGAKWLGGSLGQAVLVFRISDVEYRKNWRHSAETQQEIKNFGWAYVVYDPFCRAYNLGSATKEACKSSQAERHAVTAKQLDLRKMSDSESEPYLAHTEDMVSGPGVGYDWTTPAHHTTALTAVNGRVVKDKDAYFEPVTVLKPGQKLTGGELGARSVILPTTYKRYYNEKEYGNSHILLEDPIRNGCQADIGIRPYLGPDVLRHAYACN